MLKYELLQKNEYQFLNYVPQQVVVITGRIVEDGEEVSREINIEATRRLHQRLQARSYGSIPADFEGQKVVTLDEALSGLFRAHPYTGEPIDNTQNSFHPTNMSQELFLGFLFAQEVNELSKGTNIGRRAQKRELDDYLTYDDFRNDMLERVRNARVASSISNPDKQKLSDAEARIWWQKPHQDLSLVDIDSELFSKLDKNTKRIILTYQRRLQKLKEQEALLGANADPSITIQIEDVEDKIAELMMNGSGSSSKPSGNVSATGPNSIAIGGNVTGGINIR